MYKLNKITTLTKLCLRGYNLTKKLNKNQTKHSLVFLRAPKHFNIGKHKVLSFKNFYKHTYGLSLSTNILIFVKYPYFFYNIILNFHKFHLLYKINSIKITAKLKIQFI
jgi:hypothetical protein